MEFDTCLFIWDKVICIVYANEILFRKKYEEDITQVLLILNKEGVDTDQENDADGFFGVELECDAENGLIEIC